MFVLLSGLVLFFLRFGYDYGTSDQDEVLPFLMHRMDPSLFTQDWFVATQTADYSVRTYFVWLLHSLSLIFPTWLAMLFLWVAAWLLIAGAVYVLTRHFTRDRLAAAAVVIVTLVLTPRWTLGGNDLVHAMMVPSMLGWALALWAIYHFLHSRFILSPVMLGVACWFQALVGLQVGALLIAMRLINILRKEKAPYTVGSWLMFTALFILWCSPAVGPLVWQQLAGDYSAPADLPDIFYIMAAFRLPHHYLPLSFDSGSVVRFLGLAGIGAAALARSGHMFSDRTFLVRTLGAIGGALVLAFLFTEIVPLLLVAKAQVFKITVLAKVLLTISIIGAVAALLPGRARIWFESLLERRRLALGAVLVVCAGIAAGIVLSEDGYLHDLVGPWRRADAPIGQAQQWIRTSTPHDAVFAIPPSVSSFRSATERTIVVNFKAVPFEDEQLGRWFTRLHDLAPVQLPERGGSAIIDDLDAAYHALTWRDLVRLRQKHGFDHVLRTEPLDANPAFEEVYSNGEWYVFRSRDEVRSN